MKKNFGRKWMGIPFILALTTVLIVPNVSFAANSSQIDTKQPKSKRIHSPWEESKDPTFPKDSSSNIETNSSTELLYDDEAIKLFKKLENSNNNAKQNQIDSTSDNPALQSTK